MKNKDLAIIGYSGHSFVCLEIALLNNFRVLGYYDLLKKSFNPYNLKFLGSDDNIPANKNIFISIGDNKIRYEIYKRLSLTNLEANLIHPSSIISNNVSLDNQILICAGSKINPHVKIGSGAIINTGCIVEHECTIGNFFSYCSRCCFMWLSLCWK